MSKDSPLSDMCFSGALGCRQFLFDTILATKLQMHNNSDKVKSFLCKIVQKNSAKDMWHICQAHQQDGPNCMKQMNTPMDQQTE